MSDNVFLIGVDAGSFRIIDPMITEGKLPNLEALLEDGYSATLESSMPPWTPTAWTSLTAGKNPGKHGIFDFKTPDGERLVNGTDVRTNRIWDYLTAAGKQSIVVNVPVTHPAPEIDGVLIPGYLSPEGADLEAHPDGIVDELQAAIGDYRIYADDAYQDPEDRCSDYVSLLRMRRDAIIYLCDSYAWDFAMVQFQRTDTVFHELPAQHHIEHVYSRLDEFIGDILDAVEYDTVIVASDHGMGPTGTWDVRLNTWLHREGYLETSLNGRETGWEKPTADSPGRKSTFGQIISGLSRIGVTPRRAQTLLNRLGLTRVVKRVASASLLKEIVQTGGEKYDPEASIAYCPSGPGLGIYCDDAVVEELLDSLAALTDPDGNDVFEWVVPASDVWDGPMAETGPDVLVMPREMDYYVSATISANAFEKAAYEYNHERNGVLMAAGSDVEDNGVRNQHSLRDIAPTVLAAMDIPLDTEFDGQVIEPIVADGSWHEKEYETVRRRSQSVEDDVVESRLEDLGYME